MVLDNFDDPLLVGLYAVPFLVAMALPGWRSLVVAGLGGGALAAWAWTGPGKGVGAALGLLFILIIVVGLFCGILARATTLRFAPLRRRPFGFVAIGIAGFFLPPMLLDGPSASLRWLTQPSLRTCRASTFSIRVAGQTLRVPGAPMFSVFAPQGARYGDRGGILWFQSDHSLREICRRTLMDGEIVGPSIMYLNGSDFSGSHGRSWTQATCPSPRSKWEGLLCELAKENDSEGRLQNAMIYGPELSQEANRHDSSQMASTIVEWLTAGRPVERGSKSLDGSFEIRSDGMRISQAADLAGPSGEPFGLMCSEGKSQLCAAAGTLENGAQVRFTIRTTPDRVEEDARTVFTYLNELTRALSAAPT